MPNSPGRVIKKEIADIIKEMGEEKKKLELLATKECNNKKE